MIGTLAALLVVGIAAIFLIKGRLEEDPSDSQELEAGESGFESEDNLVADDRGGNTDRGGDGDSDGDGFSDDNEIAFGSDPADSADSPSEWAYWKFDGDLKDSAL